MEQIKKYGPQMNSAGSAIGTLLSAKGAADEGRAAERLAIYRVRQMEQNAGQSVAAATVAASEEQRKSALIASRAMAVAAASGAGSLDPTVVRILQGINAEGALASATQMYNGEEEARGMLEQARATRYEGASAKRAGKTRALSTILGGLKNAANTWGTEPAPSSKTSSPFSNGGFKDTGTSEGAYA